MNQNQIRNFIIISHIDHGKSTLADRFLELTGTITKDKMQPQYLDMMELEKEKGITIKLQPVQMNYTLNGESYTLNLIDTPGHVDFSYEVSRSLAAVEGAILLVDATKGIQAQTIGNLELARKQNLVIIPVINKTDLSTARIKETEKELAILLSDQKEIIKISAKSGENVERILKAVVSRVAPPVRGATFFRALIFDSKYDSYKGVIAIVRIFDGEIKKGQKIYLMQGKIVGEAKEVGVFKPESFPVEKLAAGEIGYIATGIKDPRMVRVGETVTSYPGRVETLPGYQEPKPVVFLSIYPENPDDFTMLLVGLEKLKLNDAALCFKPELKKGLGRGFQCGFLGLLHAEIITERLKREFELDLVLSTPSVIYKILTIDNQEFLICTTADWIDSIKIKESKEMWIKLRILTPLKYLGFVLELLKGIESRYLKTDYTETEKAELVYEVPLREIITKNFYDKLKGVSQGFASMHYDHEILSWRTVDLVRLDILVSGKKEEAFAKIVPKKEAYKEGKKIVEKLKQALPAQLFAVSLQAVIGGKVIARETIRAKGRDVIAPLYGGDYTRKRKLLEQQKKGKKELQEKGRIKIPSKVFLEIFTA